MTGVELPSTVVNKSPADAGLLDFEIATLRAFCRRVSPEESKASSAVA